jgi:hypothetical protein
MKLYPSWLGFIILDGHWYTFCLGGKRKRAFWEFQIRKKLGKAFFFDLVLLPFSIFINKKKIYI